MANTVKSDVFEIMQYEFKPGTNEPLNFNENNIVAGLNHKTIKEWAYIKHDKDIYTQKDYDKFVKINPDESPKFEVGDPKNVHWHCVIKCTPRIDVETVARWFGVPEWQVDVPKGRGKWLDKIEYLTHEHPRQQEQGKHRYDDSEVIASFDFRKALNERNEHRARYGGDLSHTEQLRNDVLTRGVTLKQIRDTDPLSYQRDYRQLQLMRQLYINEFAEVPNIRMNFYIYGDGGTGKGLLSKSIARAMFPELESDEEIFFEIGGEKVSFDGYDGQPVIIWNDVRGDDLARSLGGAANLFNVFDITPTNGRVHIKYGSIKLINKINIMNSSVDYSDFIEDVFSTTEREEDCNQLTRRIPFVLPMRYTDFDFLINKGIAEDTNEFSQYIEYKRFTVNIQQLQRLGKGNKKALRQAEQTLLTPIVDKHNEIVQKRNVVDENVTPEDILKDVNIDSFEEGRIVNFTDRTSTTVKTPQTFFIVKEICKNCGSVFEHKAVSQFSGEIKKHIDSCKNCELPF